MPSKLALKHDLNESGEQSSSEVLTKGSLSGRGEYNLENQMPDGMDFVMIDKSNQGH